MPPKKRTTRKTGRGPYHTKCKTCGEEFTTAASEDRHVTATHHVRYELVVPCQRCRPIGSGTIPAYDSNGDLSQNATCPQCHGTGRYPSVTDEPGPGRVVHDSGYADVGGISYPSVTDEP